MLHHTSESFIKFPGVAEKGSRIAEIIAQYDLGRIGIICFFLISGFVIPFSLKHSHHSPIKTFAIRRFFRLFPIYWVSLFLIIVTLYFWNKDLNPSAILANTTMLQSFFAEPHMIGLYWTLQIELIFYTLCAILFYYKKLDSEKVIFIMIMIGFGLFISGQAIILLIPQTISITKEFQIMPYLIAIMFLGSLFRMIYDNKQSKYLKIITILSTLICFGPPLLLWLLDYLNVKLFVEQFRFGAAHTLALVLFFVGMKWFKSSHKLLIGLGTISYSLYLFHPIVMRVMIYTFPDIAYLHGWHVSFYMMTAIVISILISILTYRMIEKPSINFSYKF